MGRARVIAVCVVAWLGTAAVAHAEVTVQSPPITVVPSSALPPQVQVGNSNANLSITQFRHRVFMVFRTAKWQIADDNARMYVVSTVDQVHWRYEGQFWFNTDVREPRLLVYHGKLFLYMALLGSNAAAFDPGGTVVTHWLGPNRWTKPKHILQGDFIPWDVAVHHGKAYMTGYTGGGGTFQPNPPPKYVYWLTSSDGVSWHAVNPKHPIVYTGQCGETSFAFLPSGGIVTACQTEEVDKLGWGAKVCTAPARATWLWSCRGDTRRLDSPFVFVDRGRVYVIARRQVAFNGEYDYLHYNLPDTDVQFAMYDGEYAATTKRCALWSIDPATQGFTSVVDVPGVGDTCYPSLIPEAHHRYLVYNYTSPLDGSDPPWGTAVTVGKTLIYRQTLTFR
ncbi:MAG TPA: hypothetical protein VGH24_07075 [Solirubrobacteraceae bacterium]